jgi:hypothetical protein
MDKPQDKSNIVLDVRTSTQRPRNPADRKPFTHLQFCRKIVSYYAQRQGMDKRRPNPTGPEIPTGDGYVAGTMMLDYLVQVCMGKQEGEGELSRLARKVDRDRNKLIDGDEWHQMIKIYSKKSK